RGDGRRGPDVAVRRTGRPQTPGRITRRGCRRTRPRTRQRGRRCGVLVRDDLRTRSTREALLRWRSTDEHHVTAADVSVAAQPGEAIARPVLRRHPAEGTLAGCHAGDEHGEVVASPPALLDWLLRVAVAEFGFDFVQQLPRGVSVLAWVRAVSERTQSRQCILVTFVLNQLLCHEPAQ